MYEPHSNGKFNVRYWFDASNYKPGGPVIVLMGGETSGDDRLVYLQKGILAQMAKATNGVGVVLEHRYYGSSFPTPDLSTENLRFLTTDQSLADSVDFAENVKFKGLENYNLNAPHTPWIAYGGSYAGAYVAILRKLYPDTYWGAISSSGVTVAQWNFWQYYEAARIYGPQECVKATQLLTNAMDNIFMKNKKYGPTLKKAFGLEAFMYDDDFMNFLSNYGIAGLQGLVSKFLYYAHTTSQIYMYLTNRLELGPCRFLRSVLLVLRKRLFNHDRVLGDQVIAANR